MVADGVYFGGSITTYLRSYSYSKNVTSVGDSCTIVLSNPCGVANSEATYFEDIKIYSGGGTLVWRGVVFDIKPMRDGTIIIEGSGYMRFLMSRFHTGEFAATARSAIVESLVDDYGETITTVSNITATGDSITRTFKAMSVYDAILDLANEVMFDFWVDNTLEFHFEEREATSSGVTLNYSSGTTISVDVPNEAKTMYNRVLVYGDANQDGVCETVVLVENLASQLTYGVVKEYEPIVDRSLATEAECTARGQEIMDSNSIIVPTAVIETFGQDTLNVGETIVLANYNTQYGLTDGTYIVLEIASSNITKIHRLKLAKYDKNTADMISDLIKRMRKREYGDIDDSVTAVQILRFYETVNLSGYTIDIYRHTIGTSFIAGHPTNGVTGHSANAIKFGRTGATSTSIYSSTG